MMTIEGYYYCYRCQWGWCWWRWGDVSLGSREIPRGMVEGGYHYCCCGLLLVWMDLMVDLSLLFAPCR